LIANKYLLQLPISHANEARRAMVIFQKYKDYHKWRVHSGSKKHRYGNAYVAEQQGQRRLRFYFVNNLSIQSLGALLPSLATFDSMM